jgi:vancomycin aglycone glucosyltransferase
VIIADEEGKESVRSLPLSEYSAPGACGKARIVLQHCRTMPKPAEMGVMKKMHVVLSTCGSRGDVEPMAGLAVKLRTLGAEVWVCARPDCAELLGRVGVPLVPMGVWR